MRLRVAALVLAVSCSNAAAMDFLVPGMPLAAATLAPGERAAYLVVSRSLGSADSSYVEIAVLERDGGRIRLEFVFAPYPRMAEETTTVRMRLEERVLSISSAAEFRACVVETLVREGSGRFRPATEEEIDDLGVDGLLIPPDSSRVRTALAPRTVRTKAGEFACAGIATSRRDEREVTLGGVKAKRIEEERTVLWRSAGAPLWGLVEASVERRSIVEHPGASFPGAPRVTVTESSLIPAEKSRPKR